MKSLKNTSRIFAVLAVFFVLIAILVAAGVAGNSSGFLDLSNIVAIAILGIALVCSVVAAVTSLIYKMKIKFMVSDSSTIGVIIRAERRGLMMKKGMVLRIISLVMFVAAIIFIACALANPALGRTFYIGDIAIGAEVWRVFYAIYAIVMAILFVLSFFVGKPTGGIKAGILKLLIFVPVLVFAFIMGAVLILEFAWWKLLAFIVISVGLGHGVYYLFRLVDRKCGGACI